MLIPRSVLGYLANKALPQTIGAAIDSQTTDLNSAGFDRWGLEPQVLKAALATLWPLYKYYFRVRTIGGENIPKNSRVMLVANHSGQFPIDAMLIMMALLDREHPRVVRGMVEYWVPTLPFISDLFTRCGQVVGEPNNCIDLLNNEQCLLVFPEGVGGLGKPYRDCYQLQKFGMGFARMALDANTPIVPVSVVGAEEFYPSIGHLEGLAKLLKAPYFPVTPTFPLLGLLGALPLPSPVDIYFGEPILLGTIVGDKARENQLNDMVTVVKDRIQTGLNAGLTKRSGPLHMRRTV